MDTKTEIKRVQRVATGPGTDSALTPQVDAEIARMFDGRARSWPTDVSGSSLSDMTTVADISGAVKRLPKKELARFRKWFAEYDAAVWDSQIESDVAAGKLDALLREAQREHRAGRTKPL